MLEDFPRRHAYNTCSDVLFLKDARSIDRQVQLASSCCNDQIWLVDVSKNICAAQRATVLRSCKCRNFLSRECNRSGPVAPLERDAPRIGCFVCIARSYDDEIG